MIFIDASTLAELRTYPGLLKTIGRWLERDDLGDMAPQFVYLAEARFNRLIRSPTREARITIPLTGTVDLPADCDNVRHLFSTDTVNRVLEQVSPTELHARRRDANDVTVFSIVGTQLVVSPEPDTDITARLTYSAHIPHLTNDLTTNWLLDRHPDLYLYASLMQAEAYGWNDERAAGIKSLVDEMIGEINRQADRQRYGPSPLVMRPLVYEYGTR